jgi:hypothetical protein
VLLRRLQHVELRGGDERLFELDRLHERVVGDVGIHPADLVAAVAFAWSS